MSYEMTNQILGKRIVAITYPQKGNGETIITFEDGIKFTLGACESLNLKIPAKGGSIEWDKKLGIMNPKCRGGLIPSLNHISMKFCGKHEVLW